MSSASDLSLEGALASVKTSNGDSWWLTVGWFNADSSAGSAVAQVGLEHETTKTITGWEVHAWTFHVKSSTLSFNDKTGTLNLGTEASPVAKLDLTFTTTSSKAATCTSGKETDYLGKLKGTGSLVTGLKGGGTVKGTFTFNVTTPEIVVDQGCVPPAANSCGAILVAGSGGSSPSTPAVFAGTFTDGSAGAVNVVGIDAITTLVSPKGATRQDTVARVDKKGQVFATYTGSAVKLASSGGLVTGSATINGGKPTSSTFPCSYKGKNYKEAFHTDDPADYAGSFTAKPAIGNVLTVPKSSKSAFYEVVTSTSV